MTLTILATISSLLVVTSTSTVYSVLWLVTTFILVSIVLGLLNLGFTALLYIIVYVGAIAILFLFVVQLLDLGSVAEIPTEDDLRNAPRASTVSLLPLASIITVALASILVITGSFTLPQPLEDYTNNLDLNDVTGTLHSLNLDPVVSTTALETGNTGLLSIVPINHVHAIADWFYGPGLLPLVIVSIILLVAMIAPIYLCKE